MMEQEPRLMIAIKKISGADKKQTQKFITNFWIILIKTIFSLSRYPTPKQTIKVKTYSNDLTDINDSEKNIDTVFVIVDSPEIKLSPITLGSGKHLNAYALVDTNTVNIINYNLVQGYAGVFGYTLENNQITLSNNDKSRLMQIFKPFYNISTIQTFESSVVIMGLLVL